MPDTDDPRNGHSDVHDDAGASIHPFPRPRAEVDQPVRGPDGLDEPIDLAAMAADDELIDALAAGTIALTSGAYRADDQVVALLTAWRADVTAEPIPELVDLDTAVAAVRAGAKTVRHTRSGRSGKGRHLAPVAAAAALLVVVGGGVSLGSATAQPDSVLWPLSKVLFSERAVSVQAADRVSTKIETAKQALNEGKSDVAATELAQAQQDLSAVRPQEGHAQLADVKNFLVAKAAETPSGTSVDPASPLRTDKSRPIPAGAALSQQPTATGTLSPTSTSTPTPTPTSTPTDSVVPTTTSTRPSHSTGAHPTSKPTTTPPVTPTTEPLTDSLGAPAPPGTTAPVSTESGSSPTAVDSGPDETSPTVPPTG